MKWLREMFAPSNRTWVIAPPMEKKYKNIIQLVELASQFDDAGEKDLASMQLKNIVEYINKIS